MAKTISVHGYTAFRRHKNQELVGGIASRWGKPSTSSRIDFSLCDFLHLIRLVGNIHVADSGDIDDVGVDVDAEFNVVLVSVLVTVTVPTYGAG